jgi:hypothetical protein
VKMTDVDARLAELESRRIVPGLSVAEQNELRDCEITLGMAGAPPAPALRLRVESSDSRPSAQPRKRRHNSKERSTRCLHKSTSTAVIPSRSPLARSTECSTELVSFASVSFRQPVEHRQVNAVRPGLCTWNFHPTGTACSAARSAERLRGYKGGACLTNARQLLAMLEATIVDDSTSSSPAQQLTLSLGSE